MAKKLFAFLGTGDYEEVEYYFTDNSKEGCVTKYIQEALGELLNESELKITVFITKKAREKHWDSEGRDALKIRLEKLNVEYKAVDIPSGQSNDEIWQIFTKVYDEIELNDEIYVDVTHSFRSIPIMFMSVLNYAKVTKSCDVRRILYGAYEARENERAPIYDLTLFDQITEWSSGVEQLLATGECDMFCSTIKRTISPLLREAKGNDELIILIKKCTKYIVDFYTDLKLVRGQSVLKDGKKLYQVLNEIEALYKEQYISIQPFFNMLGKIKDQVSFFRNDNLIENILDCVRLCRNFGQYQQAYTFLRENFINYVCINTDLDWRKAKPDRIIAERAVNSIYKKNKEEEEEESSLKVKVDFIDREAIKLYANLIFYRNDLDHAQFREDNPSTDKIINRLGEFIESFEEHVIKKQGIY